MACLEETLACGVKPRLRLPPGARVEPLCVKSIRCDGHVHICPRQSLRTRTLPRTSVSPDCVPSTAGRSGGLLTLHFVAGLQVPPSEHVPPRLDRTARQAFQPAARPLLHPRRRIGLGTEAQRIKARNPRVEPAVLGEPERDLSQGEGPPCPLGVSSDTSAIWCAKSVVSALPLSFRRFLESLWSDALGP